MSPRPPRTQRPAGSAGRAVLLVPALWLGIFVLVPGIIVLRMSLSEPVLAQPPYQPLFDLAAGWAGVRAFLGALSFENFALLLSDTLYLASYGKSLAVAAVSTAILLLTGYPMAYAIARAPRRWQPVLMTLVTLPFLTAFLIRIYAWITILQGDGLLNRVLIALGVVDAPVVWLATDTAVYLGIVYSYLPFMILPLYATLEKMDPALDEAAADLGCPPWKAFWLVTLPLSAPGVAAGALLCFIPITGEFVVPDLLGPSSSLMIGQTLWTEFFANRDWPLAAAVAVVMLALLLTPILLYGRTELRAGKGH